VSSEGVARGVLLAAQGDAMIRSSDLRGIPLREHGRQVRIDPAAREPDVRKTLGGYRSKWEAEYADVLALRQAAGEVSWWSYESWTVKLADDCRYTADFIVGLADGSLEAHEVKGHMWAKNVQKFKLAAEAWCGKMFAAFVMVRKVKGQWFEIKRYERAKGT
jgi:hypothetical protein